MRYFLIFFLLSIAWLCPAQNFQPDANQAVQHLSLNGKRAANDSLSMLRRVKRKHRDSMLRMHQRDSLRAGFFIHFKGSLVSIQTVRGEELADSLSHPLRVAKEKKRKKDRADSLLVADSAGTSVRLNSKSGQPAGKGSSSARIRDSLGLSSLRYYLTPISAKDSVVAATERLLTYYRRHNHFDSIPERITAATLASLNSNADIDVHRPLARRGSARRFRESWIISILLLVLVILAMIKVRFPKDMHDIFQGLFNDRMIREINLVNSPAFIFMFLGFCLTAALVIYEYLNFLHLNETYEGINLYLVLLASMLGFFIFKLISYQLSAVIFKIERMVHPFVSFLYITIANFTLACIPFLCIFCFYNASLLPYLVRWIPFLFLTFLLFLYVRSMVFFITNFEFPKFYLFLYFCTLEICPLIIVFKLIKG